MSDDEDATRDVNRAERAMGDDIKDMERELEHLDDDIKAARDSDAEMIRMTGDDGGDIAGDWRDTDDASGGEDPKGA